jgi:penicillin-binding protein 1A
VLEVFAPIEAETAMPVDVAQTLVDAMRGVIDQGTGTSIRYRFGIRADVAGKTGTTQDNTDGWFILMHPQLVAGAWVGFNDNRVTMGDSWGQGARSALPMVGEFFQQAIRAKVVDQQVRFDAPKFGGNSDNWRNPDVSTDSSEADPLRQEENGLPNDESLPGAADPANPVFREDSGMTPQESVQSAPVIRYITVPPPQTDLSRQAQEMQAMPRPFEQLPPEGRRPRRAELSGRNMDEAPEYPASDYRPPR